MTTRLGKKPSAQYCNHHYGSSLIKSMERSLSETPTSSLRDNPLITVDTLCSKTRRKERKEFTQETTLNCFKSQLEYKQATCIFID